MLRPFLTSTLVLFTACAPRVQPEVPAAVPTPGAGAAAERAPGSGINFPAYCEERPGERADSVSVRPVSVALRVGETLALRELQIRPVGTADSLAHTPVRFELRSPVAKIEEAHLVATTPGNAELRVRPLCRLTREDRSHAPVTVVPVTVGP